jgi:heptosyltransferase-2
MATPILEDLRINFPKSKITAMCIDSLSCLLQNNKNIDEVISFKKPKKFFSKENKEIIIKIKKKDFDLGVLLTNSFSSAYLFWGAKVKSLGYSCHFRRLFLNMSSKIKDKEKKHLVQVYKELLLPLGLKKLKAVPKIYLDDQTIKNSKDLLEDNGYIPGKKLVGINPLAAYGPAKCWAEDNFKQVAKALLEDKDLFLVFIGDKKSQEKINEIVKDFSKERVINLCGKTNLLELVGVINHCNVFVTNDSGPMHIAAALSIPLVSIFGSTSDIMTGPYKTGVVINKKVLCSPCFRRKCNRDFACMNQIMPMEVLSKIKGLLYV